MSNDNDVRKAWRDKNRDEINRKQREWWKAKQSGSYVPKRNLPDGITEKQRKAIDEMTLCNIGATRKMIAEAAQKYVLQS